MFLVIFGCSTLLNTDAIVPSESIKINFDKLTQDQKEFLAINTCNYLIKNMTIDDNGHLIVNIQ